MRKIRTVPEWCDDMIASYKKLDREAHDMFDLYVEAARLEEYPDTPIGSLKQMLLTDQAGTSLNVPRALQILKERKCAERAAYLERKKRLSP
jgi:hypothetical protein